MKYNICYVFVLSKNYAQSCYVLVFLSTKPIYINIDDVKHIINKWIRFNEIKFKNNNNSDNAQLKINTIVRFSEMVSHLKLNINCTYKHYNL